MIKTTTIALSITLILTACIPAIPFPQLTEEASQSVDVQATGSVMTVAAPSATATSPPSPTSPLVSATAEATATLSDTAVAETQVSETMTSVESTVTSVSTETTETPTGTLVASSTPILEPPGNPVATETLHARFFGTLPPAIAYGKIRLVNKAKVEVYISMQCTTPDGTITILEYPVSGQIRVSAPAGKYNYVAWVGGRQITGFFGLGKQEDLTITIYKDKVTVKK
jgi:hypothetical protein